MKKTVFILSLLAALMLCGCEQLSNDKNDPPEEPIIRSGGIVDRIFNRPDPTPLRLAPSNAQMGYAQMGADFAQELFNRLCVEAKPEENVCISPLSLEIALGMLANGLSADAQAELLEKICGKGVSIDDLNAWYVTLRSALEATNSVSLANALWAQTGYPINPDFYSVNETYYDAEVGNLDFTKTDEAVDSICQWAYDHTYGNIRALNLPLKKATKMVMTNATWFGAHWEFQFSEGATKQDFFTKTDGESQTVNMMRTTGPYMYAAAEKYSLLTIPFEFGSFSMVIALPDKKYSVNQILPLIDWDQMRFPSIVNLQLPKFDFKTTNTLLKHLQALGMKKLFSPDALSGINSDLEIDFINQDVSVSIDENGAEMAAVTTVEVSATLANLDEGESPKTINFFVDRPFVFAVRENVSNNILFIGKVEEVEYHEENHSSGGQTNQGRR